MSCRLSSNPIATTGARPVGGEYLATAGGEKASEEPTAAATSSATDLIGNKGLMGGWGPASSASANAEIAPHQELSQINFARLAVFG